MNVVGATWFSGIGAPELACPEIRWAWSAEIDRFASAVHAERIGSPNLGDVTAHDFCERAARIARPDLIVFGSPRNGREADMSPQHPEYTVTVWDHEGDIVRKIWEATDADIAEMEEIYGDGPYFIQVEERP